MSVRGRTVFGRDSIREGTSVAVCGCSRFSLREVEDTRRGKCSESGRWLSIALVGSLVGEVDNSSIPVIRKSSALVGSLVGVVDNSSIPVTRKSSASWSVIIGRCVERLMRLARGLHDVDI